MLTIWQEAENSAQNGNYKNAETLYTKLIEELEKGEFTHVSYRSEQLALAYNNRGHAKYKQVCFDAATEDYNRAIESQPSLAVAYYNRATVFYRMGNFQQAAADLKQTLHLCPSFSEANIALSKTLKIIHGD